MTTEVIESDNKMHLSALNMRSDWFFLILITSNTYHFLTVQCADKDQQESRAVAGKPHLRCRCKIQ